MKKKMLLLTLVVLAVGFVLPAFAMGGSTPDPAAVTSQGKERFLGKWEGEWNAPTSHGSLDIHYKDQKIVVVYSYKTTGYYEAREFVPEFSRDARGVVMTFTGGHPVFEFWFDEGGNLIGKRTYSGHPTFTITMKPVK
jgi:hypothetical protein